MNTNPICVSFPSLLQEFFTECLVRQRNVSPQTVASYRDAFMLLLQFAERQLKKPPTDLCLSDLDGPLVLSFLDHLEQERHVTVRTRNSRLAAIRSFMRYASSKDIASLPHIQRVLGIPMKRFDRPAIEFLSRDEMQAIIDASDTSTWSGHRDQVLFTVLYNTGARVSEITGLKVDQLTLGQKPFVLLHGKGRKQRTMPLWKSTAKSIEEWFQRMTLTPNSPVFPNRFGGHISRSGVENRLQKLLIKASACCPSLRGRDISPHTVRHTTAMHLLQSGVDITVIALWLGHESPATTHLYVEADLAMKEKTLGKLQPPSVAQARFRATDDLLAFLKSL
jgi:site-specific recombinase XerD